MRDKVSDEKLLPESSFRQIRITGLALQIEMAYIRILPERTNVLSARNDLEFGKRLVIMKLFVQNPVLYIICSI
jgi:hypothetical protein